jgi:polysaccharide transporter, PST family
MTLIKTSLLVAISTIARMVSGFIINKVIAVYVGPSGLAIVGQLQNFNSLIMTFAKGGISQGLVKYTAEFDSIEEKKKLFSTSLVICIMASVPVSIVLLLFSESFSTLILKDIAYQNIFIVFGFTVILFALNSIILSILNGQKEIKKFISINIISSIFSLFFTSFLIIKYGLMGALYALVLNQSVVFFITLLFLTKTSWFKVKYFIQGVDKELLSKLSKFSLMAIVTAIVVPTSHLVIRNYIGESLSWDDAGYWQGMWYISTMYLLFITTALSVYYTPKLSELKNNNELKKEIKNGYIKIIPFTVLFSVAIYILREDVIRIAFSESFLPMLELFKWQLAGDVMKISSYLLSTMMIAKAMTKKYIYSELFFSGSFVLLAIFFIQQYGLVGITYAYFINYLFYFFFLVFSFRWLFYEK